MSDRHPQFPRHRPRRLRRTATWRRMVRETRLTAEDLIQPLFVTTGEDVHEEVVSMPGVFRMSIDRLVDEAAEIHDSGVPAVLLFGLPATKDAEGTSAWDPDGVVPRAIATLKRQVPELQLWADVCLCEYTDHGHCGIVTEDGEVDNDATLPLLARAAATYGEAGADAVAPSDMMDGRIGRVREALDEIGMPEVAIVSYAAKYASAFYGPFRDAADSAPAFGDRRSYQMDPANAIEALREVALDIDEGADVVMVKPAGAYLDIVHRVRQAVDVPVAAYQVSGEYSLIRAAAANGWVDGERVAMESLVAMRRAGADLLVTYFAKEAARWIAEGRMGA